MGLTVFRGGGKGAGGSLTLLSFFPMVERTEESEVGTGTGTGGGGRLLNQEGDGGLRLTSTCSLERELFFSGRGGGTVEEESPPGLLFTLSSSTSLSSGTSDGPM